MNEKIYIYNKISSKTDIVLFTMKFTGFIVCFVVCGKLINIVNKFKYKECYMKRNWLGMELAQQKSVERKVFGNRKFGNVFSRPFLV